MPDEQTDQESAEREPEAPRGLGGFAAGVVVGVVLGAGLALLFAPERGESNRRRLQRRLARLRESAAGGFERMEKQARQELARRRSR